MLKLQELRKSTKFRVLYSAFVFLWVFLFTLSSSSILLGQDTVEPMPKDKSEAHNMSAQPYVPGQVLVQFEEGVPEAKKERLKDEVGTEKTIDEIERPDEEDIEVIEVNKVQSVEAVASELEADPDVANAEPNYVYDTNFTPNDPSFGNQWYLNNTGQTIKGQVGTPGADIKGPGAWDITTGGEITVAVIDTGIDLSHPDLASKIWQNTDEIAGNGVDDDGNGYIDDRNGFNTAGISQLSANTWWYFGRASNGRVAQSIKGTGEPLTHVGILLAKVGSPTAAVNISVRTSLTGPNLSSATITPNQVSSSFRTVYKQLNTPVKLNSGQTYYLVFETTGADTNNYYGLADNYSLGAGYRANPYADGAEHWFENGAWRDYPSDDFYFITNPNAVSKDDHGHGTHVGGTIGASTDNGVGISGISQGAKIMPLKAGTSDGRLTTAAIIEAIYYATDNGATIINMSFGGSGQSALMISALNYADANGVSLFASAGNSGNGNMSYPAGYEHVIGVGATTNKDTKASFSTYNSSVDISAPGQHVYSTMPTYAVGLNSYGYGRNYDFLSGTSMASPTAAGVAALLRAQNPALTPAQVEQAMKDSADDLGAAGRDDKFGQGRVNALKALGDDSVGTSPSAITGTVTINSGAAFANSRNVTLSNSAESSGAQVSEMRFRNDGAAWSAWEPYASTKSWALPVGDGNKNVEAEFKDSDGATTQVSDTIAVDTAAPSTSLRAPRISTKVTKTTRFKIRWAGRDPAPASGIAVYDVQYKVGGGAWQNWKTGTTATQAYFTGQPGLNYIFRVRATDRAGNVSRFSSKKRTIVPFDNNTGIRRRRGFGRVQSFSGSGYYLNTIRFSTRSNDYIAYRFTGRRVYLISTRRRNGSKAKIYVDGKYVRRINTYSKRTRNRQVVFSKRFSRERTHTLKIVNIGNRRRLDVDGLAVLSQRQVAGVAGNKPAVKVDSGDKPTTTAATDVVRITGPTSNKLIRETPDFPTERFADPWDMSNRADLTQGEHTSGLKNMRWKNGMFTARSTGYATTHPLFAGVQGVVFTSRDGYRNRIGTRRFNRISVRMYSSRRAKAQIYWFYNQTWSNFGNISFRTEPGWHTYIINPRSSGKWKGKPMGMRLDPVNRGGVNVKVDWMRVYRQSTRRVKLNWTDTQPGGETKIFVDKDKDPRNGNMDLLKTRNSSGSNVYKWDPSGFAPGKYFLMVRKTGRPAVYSKRITINRAPLTKIIDPDETGGKDYAQTETGDAWNMSQRNDVWYWRDMNNVTFSNGIMSGTPTSGDSHMHLRVPKGINTDVYHRLSFRFKYDGPYDYGGGTMVRTIWSPDHNKLEFFQTMNDLPTYPRWQTYTVDLDKVGIDGGNIGWNGTMNDFRFDPSEGSIRSRFHLDYIRIREDDRANKRFAIKWRDNKKSRRPTRVNLFYDNNKSGYNGRRIVTNRRQVKGTNKYVWNTENVRAGKYYIYAVARDGLNTTKTYSSGPIVIRH